MKGSVWITTRTLLPHYRFDRLRSNEVAPSGTPYTYSIPIMEDHQTKIGTFFDILGPIELNYSSHNVLRDIFSRQSSTLTPVLLADYSDFRIETAKASSEHKETSRKAQLHADTTRTKYDRRRSRCFRRLWSQLLIAGLIKSLFMEQ